MNIKKARDARIHYGNVHVSDEELMPAAVRRRISILIPEDVLSRLRKLATEEATGYQTLINRILRDATRGRSSIEARLARIERALTKRAS